MTASEGKQWALLARRLPARDGGGLADQGPLSLGGRLRDRCTVSVRVRRPSHAVSGRDCFLRGHRSRGGVGLWLAAPWGAVVWLTSVISMGGGGGLVSADLSAASMLVVLLEIVLLGVYLWLALMAAREQPA